MHAVYAHSFQMFDKTLYERFTSALALKGGQNVYYKSCGIALRQIGQLLVSLILFGIHFSVRAFELRDIFGKQMRKTVSVDGAENISDGLIEFIEGDKAVFGLEVNKIIAPNGADGAHGIVLEVGMRYITHRFGIRSAIRADKVEFVSLIHSRTA